MAKPLLQERLIRALRDCVDALDDEGHSAVMNLSLCDRECWKCGAAARATEILREIKRDS